MNATAYFKEHALPPAGQAAGLSPMRQNAYAIFNELGIPGTRHEEWKYTRISPLFNKEYQLPVSGTPAPVTSADLDAVRLPGHQQANELVFVNGRFSFELSAIRSAGLTVLPLEEAAANEYKEIVVTHLGHSSHYLKDGITALNLAFMQEGVFIHIAKGKVLDHPVYIYNITDARAANILSQPRSLVYMGERSQAELVETFITLGTQESFANQVMEIVVEKEAMAGYYKIQNDAGHTNQVSTTHIRQTGKSYVHAVAISLNGGIVRNNTNVVMEEEYAEAHLYGLYFPQGHTHIDNHTVVDNVRPNCYSNELYKGIIDDNATAVFNGKIFVRQQAQKTNAYQSNKNVLLSEGANVNTKPQLEIYADDVKCSHGCTVGRLDEEGLFYLQSRGIPERRAKSLLLQSFAMDILEKIKPALIRAYVDKLISERLELV